MEGVRYLSFPTTVLIAISKLPITDNRIEKLLLVSFFLLPILFKVRSLGIQIE